MTSPWPRPWTGPSKPRPGPTTKILSLRTTKDQGQGQRHCFAPCRLDFITLLLCYLNYCTMQWNAAFVSLSPVAAPLSSPLLLLQQQACWAELARLAVQQPPGLAGPLLKSLKVMVSDAKNETKFNWFVTEGNSKHWLTRLTRFISVPEHCWGKIQHAVSAECLTPVLLISIWRYILILLIRVLVSLCDYISAGECLFFCTYCRWAMRHYISGLSLSVHMYLRVVWGILQPVVVNFSGFLNRWGS